MISDNPAVGSSDIGNIVVPGSVYSIPLPGSREKHVLPPPPPMSLLMRSKSSAGKKTLKNEQKIVLF